MKIAFDISQAIYGTGVSHYRINLIKNLLEIDKNNNYLLYSTVLRRKGDMENILSGLPAGFENKMLPIPPKLADVIWNKLHIFPIEKAIGDFDLVHTSDWTEPPSGKIKVTTVHDVIPLKFPKMVPKSLVSVHRKKLYWVKKESSAIIVPSSNTKEDLIELGFDEGKIKVIYEAANLEKADSKKVIAVKKKYKLFDRYILAIGAAPRKNITKIIEAYHLSKAGKNLKLVIAGEMAQMGVKQERGIRYTGWVSKEDLSALLTGADALVYASLYEGLGIPILDGFACETPVVASNVSAMPELAGDAAVMVDPTNVNSIADGIETALSQPKTLIAKGSSRIKDFSWKKTAQMTLDVYNNALSQR